MPAPRDPRRDGFTLVELLVVIAIIGIIISLILVAAADGVRRAEERQTQTLITKLEAALTDRVDALLATSAPINQTHRYLAAVTFLDPSGNGLLDPIPSSDLKRAQVIAQFDFMKAEMPDVFYVNNATFFNSYPLNFAGAPYPLSNGATIGDFVLPLGNRVPGLPYTAPPLTPPMPQYDHPTPGFDPITGFNDLPQTLAFIPSGLTVVSDTGIFGASFTAAAGVYKNLYEAATLDLPGAQINTKAGYDAADNDGNGLVDDMSDITFNIKGATAAQFQAAVMARLNKHTHKTARSETLYGILVEGLGPLGSSFAASEFTNRDVADTDGDGLPEFIDAWGEPLQFFRWPIFHGSTVGSSDSQMNWQSYGGGNIPRQLDPLDPNQQVVSFAWWTTSNPGLPFMFPAGLVPDFSTGQPVLGPSGAKIFTNSPASQQANAFMTYFHITIDPDPSQPPIPGVRWDRAGSKRRAYYSKFLVLSAGQDNEPGVFQLNKDYSQIDSTYSSAVAFPTGTTITDTLLLNWCESQAAQLEYAGRGGNFLEQVAGAASSNTSLYLQQNAGLDDISNHTLTAPGAGAK